VSVNNKEDFERSIQYFKNSKGGVIRFNNVCVATQGYSGKGGMQSFDRGNNVILEDASIIAYKYPEYCDLNMTKKSGKPEIKIRQIKLEEIMLSFYSI
jgi:small nuclear ribonucleoprotein (snRNP)-like protein